MKPQRLELVSSRTVVVLALLGAGSLVACSSGASPRVESSATPPEAAPGPASAAPAAAPPACGDDQFVACKSGPDCATRAGVLLEPHACFDRARDACAALACTTGCDITAGSPKQVACAPNASSTGHMKECAGFAGWLCPEDMRCEMPTTRGDDMKGRCVPLAPTTGG